MEADPAMRQRAIRWAGQREKRARFFCSAAFVRLYRIRLFRPILLRAFMKLEGGQMFSVTLREILKREFGATVGRYSYGPCLKPGVLPRGTVIGNYCSFGEGMAVYRRDHPIHRLSVHPFFFNQSAGVLQNDTLPSLADNPLTIGHDVWVGAHVIVLPGCRTIGTGAVIGAGAVVTRDVPPFSVVAGNPARIIGARFPAEVQSAIDASEWWLRSLPELLEYLPLFTASDPSIEMGILARIGATKPMENPPAPAKIHPQSER